MPGDAVTARLHGKLPAHGDFVTRGFTRAEAEACDAWLSDALADARAVHGAAFDARYDVAPPWRFADEGVGGALALSQDAAGRRFPVYLERSTSAPHAAAAAIEELLYRAIAERWTADALATAAEALDLGGEEAVPDTLTWWLEGGDAALDGTRPTELLTRMLAVEVHA